MPHDEIDKDTVILKYQQDEIKDMDSDTVNIQDKNRSNTDRINAIHEQVQEIMDFYSLNYPKRQVPELSVVKKYSRSNNENNIDNSYDELYLHASSSLEARGIDLNKLTYNDLLDSDVIAAIDHKLNRPLPPAERWTKDDFIIVFVAAAVGMIADFVFGNRTNPLTGSGYKASIADNGWNFSRVDNSIFSDWLEDLHIHDSGNPLDFQGPGFGGGFHRELSKGHDLLRMAENIWNIKNGRFVGIRYENGQAIQVISTINQYGTSYEQLGNIEAILGYFQHMVADFFSSASLPFPGYSFLRECSDRELRILSANMYKAGFNLKNIVIQAISTIAIELILRIYIATNETKKILGEGKSFNILADYSNWENIKSVVSVSHIKYQEMFLVTHGLTTAVNLGKVIIKKAPWEINVTEMMMTVRYLIPVLQDYLWRNSVQAELARNNQEILGEWERLMNEIGSNTLQLPVPDKILELA
ncbi:MAG: hypothetical protein ABRQ24_03795 [Syntrophomonadaceae bacterium]